MSSPTIQPNRYSGSERHWNERSRTHHATISAASKAHGHELRPGDVPDGAASAGRLMAGDMAGGSVEINRAGRKANVVNC